MVPLVEETVSLFTENADADGLTPKLRQWIKRYEIVSWAEAYEDFKNFLMVQVGALSTLDEPPAVLFSPPKIESVEDMHRWLDSAWETCEQFLDDDSDDDLAFMDDEDAEAWSLVSPHEDGKPISRQAVFLTAALVVVFNYFSCMVHRKSLFQLVAEAKAGDDAALLKAIQIDKTSLSDISYFRERVQSAALAGDAKFLTRIAQYRSKPTFQSGTALNSLYLAFSLLDAIGMLSAYAEDMERFADFCQTLGIYGPADDAVDVENFARALRRFKIEYQTLSQPSRSRVSLFVKDTN